MADEETLHSRMVQYVDEVFETNPNMSMFSTRLPNQKYVTFTNPNFGTAAAGCTKEVIDSQLLKVVQADSNDFCGICHNSYNRNDIVMYLQCGHVAHQVCLKTWLKRKSQCFMCRRVVTKRTPFS
jgi:hypothetical protein